MRIKHIFEEKDFDGLGQMVTKDYPGTSKDFAVANLTYKVGYCWVHNEGQKKTLTAMSDGATTIYTNLDALIMHLNLTGYHPTTEVEMMEIAKCGNRF